MKNLVPTTQVIAAFLLVGLLTLPASAASLLIDDFSTSQGPLSVSPSGTLVDASSAAGGGIVGGARDLVLSTDVGSSPFSSSAEAAGGIVQLSDNTQFQSDLLFQWDGGDNDPTALDTSGLGGIDLTFGGNNAFEIGLVFDDLPATLTMNVYSLDGASSQVVFPTAGLIFTNLAIFVPFDLFTGSANFANVGAIELAISSPTNGLDIAFDYIQTGVAPVPVPAGLWLFASALLGFTLTSRGRREIA